MKPVEILEKELAKAEAEEVEAHKEFRRDGNAGAEKEWLEARKKTPVYRFSYNSQNCFTLAGACR